MEAARHTSSVVRRPAGRPCSLRLIPITAPATTVRNRRKAISCHEGLTDMVFLYGSGRHCGVRRCDCRHDYPTRVIMRDSIGETRMSDAKTMMRAQAF